MIVALGESFAAMPQTPRSAALHHHFPRSSRSGGAMGLQPVHGALLDQQVDQGQALAFIDGFSQQLPIAIDIKVDILFVHYDHPAISGRRR
jgi:hypothetical protein